MGENGVTQRRVGQLGDHGNLSRPHDFSGFYTEDGEARDLITFGINQGFHESACLGKCPRPKACRHRDFGEPIRDSSAINRLARSARALASFASYADQLLSNTEIVSRGPERHSDPGKAET